MPATRAGLPRLFFMRPLTVLMKQTRQAGRTIKQSILLGCLWAESTVMFALVVTSQQKISNLNSPFSLPSGQFHKKNLA
jgi:hypothetical protein